VSRENNEDELVWELSDPAFSCETVTGVIFLRFRPPSPAGTFPVEGFLFRTIFEPFAFASSEGVPTLPCC